MRNDPRRMQSKFPGRCMTCGQPTKRGEEIVYWPLARKVQCMVCGEKGYLESLASFDDERAYSAGGY